MVTFIGEFQAKVDPKGRVVLPSAFKKQLAGTDCDHFVLKKDIFEKCLVMYPIAEWERQNSIIRAKLNPYNRDHSRFIRNFYRGASEIVLDGASRLLIPKRMLELVSIESDIYFCGLDSKIEIWSQEIYDSFDLDQEAFGLLAEKLLGNNDDGSNDESCNELTPSE